MLLEEWFCKSPESTAFVLFDDKGGVHRITKGKLLAGSIHCADSLKENGVSPFTNVVLALPHSVELLYWFFGCFLVEAIPSILADPGKADEMEWERLYDMMSHVKAALLVTGEWGNEFHKRAAETGCRLLVADTIEYDSNACPPFQFSGTGLTGYVQFTSGSTGIRKAVVLSGEAIRAYVGNMAENLVLKPDDVVVSCLPLSHDFGLFGGVLMPFMNGIPAVLISPSRWVRRPAILLQAIHDYDGTISWLPNSGLVHCARFVQDREMAGVDLSKFRVLINGAEPILHSSNQLFVNRFSKYGFSENALISGYGMAENTLGATSGTPGVRTRVLFTHGSDLANKGIVRAVPESHENAVALVSCGKPLGETKIKIIDRERNSLPDGHVGEIAIQSDSLFSEYAGDKALTESALADGWFYTGDLGFIDGGELFFAGRLKDIIIVGGRNISPVEIENTAAEIPGLFPGQVVAFGVPDEFLGTERVVLVCAVRTRELTGTKDEMARKIRQHVARKTGVAISDVKLVRKGWIEKTLNGKLARAKNREKYLRCRETAEDSEKG